MNVFSLCNVPYSMHVSHFFSVSNNKKGRFGLLALSLQIMYQSYRPNPFLRYLAIMILQSSPNVYKITSVGTKKIAIHPTSSYPTHIISKLKVENHLVISWNIFCKIGVYISGKFLGSKKGYIMIFHYAILNMHWTP